MKIFANIYFEALEMYEIAREGAADELGRPGCDERVANAMIELSETCRLLCDAACGRAVND